MSVTWIWSGKSAEFKQDADYVAARAMAFGETVLQPGDIFDNKAVSVRRLRQLHDRKKIALKSRWDRYWQGQIEKEGEQQSDPNGQGENDPNAQNSGSEPVIGAGSRSAPMGSGDMPGLEEAPNDFPPEGSEQPTAAAGTEATVKHFGFGKFGVMVGEEQIAGPMTKAEAQIEALKLNS